MRTPKIEQDGLRTIKIWRGTHTELVRLNAYYIQRSHERWSLVEVLEAEAKRIYDLYEKGGTIEVIPTSPANRNQVSVRVSPTAYDHILMIQAGMMLQTRTSVRLFHVVHSVVMAGLAEFSE
jgi:hypothetical protein